jgi:hypothetical protein
MSDEHPQQSSGPATHSVTVAALPGGAGAIDAAAGDMHLAASNQADAADSDAGLIQRRIAELQAEHLALDVLIEKLIALPGVNDFELRRLKKRKLKVKDSIILLQLQLEPDTRA